MRRTKSWLALLVLTLSALAGCGNDEPGSDSEPMAVTTSTVSAINAQATETPKSTIFSPTVATQPDPTDIATTVALQPSVSPAVEPTAELQKSSVIFFSAPN